MRKLFLWILLGCLVFAPSIATFAQQDLVVMTVKAGFDGRFRENLWMPIQVSVTNNGDPIEGRLVVRPERSNALTNVFSTPVSLASGARQVIFLYASMNSFGSSLRVELFDGAGLTAAEVEVPMQSLLPKDSLYVVLSDAPNSGVDLTNAHVPEQQAAQVDWFITDLPDVASALEPINALVFSSVDSGALTTAQRDALRAWVTQGGHLIVTGGVNWQPTAAGLGELLPLVPNDAVDVDGVGALLRYAGDFRSVADGVARAAIGEVIDGAQVLASSDEGVPLLVRRTLGAGTVDYLTLDPSLEPLNAWSNLNDLWVTLLANTLPRPSWGYGILTTESADAALSILPGVTALPETLSMIFFLAAYVLVVGPINYFVLSRLNRRELAWVTIPLFIVLFTVIAWSTGFNLRGSDATLNRLSVVQVWPNAPDAYAHQLIGVLAPRRASYNLAVSDARVLRPIQAAQQGILTTASSGVDIVQSDTFTAQEFVADASYVAGFMTSGPIAKPSLEVQASMAFRSSAEAAAAVIRGSVRNDSGADLLDAVLLVNGGTYALGDVPNGELETFEFNVALSASNMPAMPSPIEMPLGRTEEASQGYFFRRGFAMLPSDQTIREVLQDTSADINGGDQETARRRSFLSTFMIDQLNSTARGGKVYLTGWVNQPAAEDTLTGANWRAVDSTLYIVEAALEVIAPVDTFTVTPDLFTWASFERQGFVYRPPAGLELFSDGVISYRFTPVAPFVLDRVESLLLVLERDDDLMRETILNLWDWEKAEWQPVSISADSQVEVANAARFIGPNNAVQVQLVRNATSGRLSVQRLGIIQRGTFNLN